MSQMKDAAIKIKQNKKILWKIDHEITETLF